MQITFRSGAQIVVDVNEYTIGTGQISDRLTSLRWKTPDNWRAKLGYLADLESIEAVVALRDEDEAAEPMPEADRSSE